MTRREFLGLAAAGAALGAVSGIARAAQTISPESFAGAVAKKYVIGHRGACAYAPENTLPSYELAIKQGADFVEQDLQITKDGVLVCSHDETLERVTNVADIFPDRFTEQTVKKARVKRWPIHDFTLKEIKQLDAGAKFDPKFKGTTIPTWQEAIDTIKGKAGLCPETKIPEVYGKFGLSMEKLVIEMLKKNGLDKPVSSTPILLQSFSDASLKKLVAAGIKHPMLQLSSASTVWTPEKLDEVKNHATAIGPNKDAITAEVVKAAHAKGLQVVGWTYNKKSLSSGFASIRAEIEHAIYDLGVDGLFTDNPDQFVRRA